MNKFKDIKTDSREVVDGDIFVAVKGFNVDHSMYISDAIKNGASMVVTNNKDLYDVPCVHTSKINSELDSLCKNYYGYNNELSLIGITGTDGKTSTAIMLKQLLDNFISTAYIGTNGIEYKNKITKTENTTPKKEELYKYFSNLKNNGCRNIVMEVSSEALLHKRVDSFKYKYAIFTNITEDHLNIHKNIKSYIKSKMKLLDYLCDDGIIITNNDDLVCRNIKSEHKIYTYGMSSDSDFLIYDIKYNKNNTSFKIKHLDKVFFIDSPYQFLYNVYNLVCAFIVCYLEGYSTNEIIDFIKELKPISGRCEFLDFGQEYNIILDYAHTFNGIKNLIENVKKYDKRIIVVTGAAGGREKEKREKIGSYLLNNCDSVIFTMDDPRYESVDSITNQMIGESKNTNYIRINDRERAINYAFDNASKDDYILIIGKGRDNYMAIEDKRIPYCDYDVILNYFTNK